MTRRVRLPPAPLESSFPSPRSRFVYASQARIPDTTWVFVSHGLTERCEVHRGVQAAILTTVPGSFERIRGLPGRRGVSSSDCFQNRLPRLTVAYPFGPLRASAIRPTWQGLLGIAVVHRTTFGTRPLSHLPGVVRLRGVVRSPTRPREVPSVAFFRTSFTKGGVPNRRSWSQLLKTDI